MKYLYIGFAIMILLSCGNSQPTAQDIVAMEHLKKLVEIRYFEVESDQAMPQASNSMIQIQNSGLLGVGNNASSINLIGNPNFLRIMGDSVKAELPYFGERQMGGAYGSREAGIEFEGLMEDYSAEWHEKKKRYIVRFRANGQTEQYQVILNLFANKTNSMIVNSNQRTPIQYTGHTKKINIDNPLKK